MTAGGTMGDVRYATVTELAHGLKRRRYSAAELAGATLALLETHGPRYNAIATLMRERALDEAARADRTRANARSSLHGVPYGAKDLVAARGAPTTWGAPPYRDQRFSEDATVITKLRRAGAEFPKHRAHRAPISRIARSSAPLRSACARDGPPPDPRSTYPPHAQSP